jgi:hypothetical protein
MSQSPGTSQEEIPRWKVVVAAGALAVVAVATVVIVLWRGPGPEDPGDAGASRDAGGVSTAAPSPRDDAWDAAGPSPAQERAELVAGVRSALDAWEAFARSAQTDLVADAFVVGGPQYRQFRREARQGRAGPAVQRVPDMALRSVLAVDGTGRRRNVLARVALTGPSGRPELREWLFVLERDSGSWRVWTVVDRTPDA